MEQPDNGRLGSFQRWHRFNHRPTGWFNRRHVVKSKHEAVWLSGPWWPGPTSQVVQKGNSRIEIWPSPSRWYSRRSFECCRSIWRHIICRRQNGLRYHHPSKDRPIGSTTVRWMGRPLSCWPLRHTSDRRLKWFGRQTDGCLHALHNWRSHPLSRVAVGQYLFQSCANPNPRKLKKRHQYQTWFFWRSSIARLQRQKSIRRDVQLRYPDSQSTANGQCGWRSNDRHFRDVTTQRQRQWWRKAQSDGWDYQHLDQGLGTRKCCLWRSYSRNH